MHHIQKYILRVLSQTELARFSEMRPPRVDSNAYSYHLKIMQREGYVLKSVDGYALDTKGLQYVDSLRSDIVQPRKQPKLIALLALNDGQGKWLLAKRKIQPYINMLMFPSGKQHHGETTLEHAKRELFEKTGQTNVSLTDVGMAEVLIHDKNNQLLTHIVAHVYSGKLEQGLKIQNTDNFEYVWYDFDEQIHPLVPGTRELHDKIKQSKTRFSIELSL